jgi:ABC-type Fe3+ transport system substrate-binding protein
MEWAKIAVALSLIALVVSTGTFVYTSQQMTSLSQQVSQYTGFPGPELYPGEAALYQQAKQEGVVIMYSIWDVGDLNAFAQAFQKRYPGIQTQFISLNNPEIITRVGEEFRAQKQTLDVIGSDSAPPSLYPLGAIQDYQTVQKDSLIYNDPRMTVVSMQVQVIGYNTKLIDQANLPKSYEDLTNPKYAKQFPMALDDPLRGGPLTWMLIGLRSYWNDDAKWTSFVRGLKALNTTTFRSTSQMARLVIAGEYAICVPCLTQDIITGKATGATVDWAPGLLPVVFPRFAAIYKYAPHPNAAKLLAEWLASADSAPVWCSLGRTPARTNVPCSVAMEQMFPGGTGVISVNPPSDPGAYIDQNLKPLWGS